MSLASEAGVGGGGEGVGGGGAGRRGTAELTEAIDNGTELRLVRLELSDMLEVEVTDEHPSDSEHILAVSLNVLFS